MILLKLGIMEQSMTLFESLFLAIKTITAVTSTYANQAQSHSGYTVVAKRIRTFCYFIKN